MPRYSEKKFVDFMVKCPRDPYKIYKMQTRLVWIGDRWINDPCNGCDNLNGHKACKDCIADITMMFYHNPDLDVSQPLTVPIHSENL